MSDLFFSIGCLVIVIFSGFALEDCRSSVCRLAVLFLGGAGIVAFALSLAFHQ